MIKTFPLLKLLFNKSTFLLIPASLFLWYSVDSFYSYRMRETQLIPHLGKIIFLDTLTAKSKEDTRIYGKGSTLIVRIDKESETLFNLNVIPNSKKTKYLLSNIKTGDSVNIFTQPRLFDGTFVRNKSTRIEKLTKGNKLIIPFNSTISDQVNFNFLTFSLIISILFLILYFYKVIRKWKKLSVERSL